MAVEREPEPEIWIHYLNHGDVQALAMSDAEIIAAVEDGLRAQGLGQVAIEPRMHLVPEKDWPGHFNVLRGYIRPLGLAGVKVVGDFYRNYEVGLPSEMALLNLMDPKTGAPVAVIDASDITDMRTGAVTALGARHLARRDSKVLGHIGARGTSYWNVRLLDSIFDFDEIRGIHDAPRAVTRSRSASPATWASRCTRRRTGSRACAAPTSWWRPRAWKSPNPCSRPRGSSRGPASFPTAR